MDEDNKVCDSEYTQREHSNYLTFRENLQNDRRRSQDQLDISILVISMFFHSPLSLVCIGIIVFSMYLSVIAHEHAVAAWDTEYLKEDSSISRAKEKSINSVIDICNISYLFMFLASLFFKV